MTGRESALGSDPRVLAEGWTSRNRQAHAWTDPEGYLLVELELPFSELTRWEAERWRRGTACPAMLQLPDEATLQEVRQAPDRASFLVRCRVPRDWWEKHCSKNGRRNER